MLYIESMANLLTGFLPNLGEALLVLIIGLVVIRFAAKITARMMATAGINAKLISVVSSKPVDDPDEVAATVIHRILMFLLVLTVLGALGAGWAAALLGGVGLVVLIVVLLVLSFRTDFFDPPAVE